jgi:hypothetical protein
VVKRERPDIGPRELSFRTGSPAPGQLSRSFSGESGEDWLQERSSLPDYGFLLEFPGEWAQSADPVRIPVAHPWKKGGWTLESLPGFEVLPAVGRVRRPIGKSVGPNCEGAVKLGPTIPQRLPFAPFGLPVDEALPTIHRAKQGQIFPPHPKLPSTGRGHRGPAGDRHCHSQTIWRNRGLGTFGPGRSQSEDPKHFFLWVAPFPLPDHYWARKPREEGWVVIRKGDRTSRQPPAGPKDWHQRVFGCCGNTSQHRSEEVLKLWFSFGLSGLTASTLNDLCFSRSAPLKIR